MAFWAVPWSWTGLVRVVWFYNGFYIGLVRCFIIRALQRYCKGVTRMLQEFYQVTRGFAIVLQGLGKGFRRTLSLVRVLQGLTEALGRP